MGRKKISTTPTIEIIEDKPKTKPKLKTPIEERKDADWCFVYEYVKKEIMGYTPDMKLESAMTLRLKGLSEGKFFANLAIKPMANYDFKVILYTFKICKPRILNWFRTNASGFKDEMHKFNSAMKIIEGEINDVVIRLRQVELSKKKTQSVSLDHIDNECADYQTKTETTKLDDLW